MSEGFQAVKTPDEDDEKEVSRWEKIKDKVEMWWWENVTDRFRYVEPFHTIGKIKYSFLNSAFRRHDLIRTKLKKDGYYDKDMLMLHGMMELLVDYVEVEGCFEVVSWDWNDDVKRVGKEIKEIYDWWKNYPIRQNQISAQLTIWHDEFTKRDGDGIKKWRNKAVSNREEIESKKLDEMEKQLSKEEEEMLIRLIKIRNYLWT
jgi:hypothetical protein